MESSPNYDENIDTLEQKMATTRTLAEALSGRHDLAGVLIDQLVEISEEAERFAVDAAVYGVRNHLMSRRNAADRLRMHSNTLQRVIDERAEHDSQETV
ncbi:hypothetical protein [Pseudonocardia sp. D17]|uniref:hypothetical protein n=1 Tax=Pseudonocardia sp. D17 TaxID=882661 RepID=UPI002B3C60E6|nr:hypothetical protein PSD17_25650 [Pseudonocardia sp. D17]